MKERVRKIWVEKDKFSCKKCGAANEFIGWNDRGSDHPTGQPEGVLFCKKCGHELTEKDELEELISIVEVQQYGFWLRFVSEHFIPCRKCQREIDKMMKTSYWLLSKRNETAYSDIALRGEFGDFRFDLHFLIPQIKGEIPMNPATEESFYPCKKCQERLRKIIETRELHIGNDNKPLVELWRKWEIDDEKTDALEKKKTY